MLKRIFSFVLLLCLALLGIPVLAQPCLVDSQYTTPGNYPSDTVGYLEVGTFADHTVQFVFAEDTVWLGYTLVFDSVDILSISGVPSWMTVSFELGPLPVRLHMLTGDHGRTCMRLSGTPSALNPSYPLYDSLLIPCLGYITLPWTSPPVEMQRVLRWRVDDPLALAESQGMQAWVISDPLGKSAPQVGIALPQAGVLRMGLYDLLGKPVGPAMQQTLAAGRHQLSLGLDGLAAGRYLLRIEAEGNVPKVLSVVLRPGN